MGWNVEKFDYFSVRYYKRVRPQLPFCGLFIYYVEVDGTCSFLLVRPKGWERGWEPAGGLPICRVEIENPSWCAYREACEELGIDNQDKTFLYSKVQHWEGEGEGKGKNRMKTQQTEKM